MREDIPSVYWEAPEHTHIEKSSDWYWAMGIIAVTASVTSIILNNVLFGIVILLGAMTVFITGNRKPRIIPFEVSVRGIRVENHLYPYTNLESWYLDEEHYTGPQLIVKSKKLLVPLIIIPIPEEFVQSVERLIAPRLIEEHLQEPLAHKILEFLGF